MHSQHCPFAPAGVAPCHASSTAHSPLAPLQAQSTLRAAGRAAVVLLLPPLAPKLEYLCPWAWAAPWLPREAPSCLLCCKHPAAASPRGPSQCVRSSVGLSVAGTMPGRGWHSPAVGKALLGRGTGLWLLGPGAGRAALCPQSTVPAGWGQRCPSERCQRSLTPPRRWHQSPRR